MIPVHLSKLGDLTDEFDYPDARDDDYTDHVRVRKNRFARRDRMAAKAKETQNA